MRLKNHQCLFVDSGHPWWFGPKFFLCSLSPDCRLFLGVFRFALTHPRVWTPHTSIVAEATGEMNICSLCITTLYPKSALPSPLFVNPPEAKPSKWPRCTSLCYLTAWCSASSSSCTTCYSHVGTMALFGVHHYCVALVIEKPRDCLLMFVIASYVRLTSNAFAVVAWFTLELREQFGLAKAMRVPPGFVLI